MNFQEWILEALPPWAAEPAKVWARRWWLAFASYTDAIGLGAKEAVKSTFPSYAPDDALPYIAKEWGGLDRYPYQTIGTWRAKLLLAYDRWQLAGTRAGLQEELESYFAPTATVVEIWTAHDVHDAYDLGNMYGGDTNVERFDLFWIVLKPPLPWTPLTMPFTLGPATLGSTADANAIQKLKRLIRKWKPAEALPAEIYVLFTGDVDFSDISDPWTVGATGLRVPFAKLLGYPTFTLGSFTLGGYHEEAA